MRNFTSIFTTFGFILLSFSTVLSQYQVQSWTTDDGLPQNTVPSIVQTADGYLWLATLDGMVRFDGVRFTVFNKNNSQGIESNRFTLSIIDRSNTLWIGTENGVVTRYRKRMWIGTVNAEVFSLENEKLIAHPIESEQPLNDASVKIEDREALGNVTSGSDNDFENWRDNACYRQIRVVREFADLSVWG